MNEADGLRVTDPRRDHEGQSRVGQTEASGGRGRSVSQITNRRQRPQRSQSSEDGEKLVLKGPDLAAPSDLRGVAGL